MRIEKQLQETDFSRFSKVKDSLKDHLHEMRSQKQELSWNELDTLAAAGRPNPYKPLKP
ncbi:hypothetical protein [Selenomonas sp. AE3005]|uniref:hypothetical protein n=1 Tax=Selenomonas sp. AE3005 TaxID=1485543 RepID=UPI001B614C34|nr:hypothetical protein [Selenomonas sp. AE3005]MBP3780649.1 hypothetical protein [Selenomonas sp.]